MKILPNLTHRQAELSDLPLLTQIEKRCFGNSDAFSRRIFRRMIINPKNSIMLDMLELDQQPVGYAAYFTRANSRSIRLYSVCLLPEWRGRGLVREYLQTRIADFSGCFEKMTLEVRKTNQQALSVYYCLGFETRGILKGYYPDGEDGLRLVKILGNELAVKK